MDTFENQEMQQEQSQPVQQESTEYHGAGAGRKEETYTGPAYSAYHTPQRPGDYQPPYYNPHYYQQPCSAEPWQPKKKKSGRKVWKGILAGVLAIAVIAGSCCATAFLTAQHMQQQNTDQLQLYIDQKVQAILDAQKNQQGNSGSTNVIVTVDGMTASQIYEKNIASVVAVTCSSNAGASAGSGFIISEDGFIVTNYHVVEGATSIKVTLASGSVFKCELRGYDATNDVAVLKAEGGGFKPVTLGRSSELKVGDPVVAIGNALGTLSFSLTSGSVSGVDREITTDGSIINMLQTDTAINSGNSGGPLFNAKGEVIGITTAKYSGTTSSGASIEGISFAIPMDDVAGIITDLKDRGYVTGAYLGISVSDVDPAAQAYGVPAGAYVVETVEGFCAARAGLRAGDIIIEVGGYKVTSVNTLSRALRNFKAGDISTIRVWRSGQEIILSLTFDEKPQA